MTSTTGQLARFATEVRYDALPADVRQNAKGAILDAIGTVLAGLDEDSVTHLRGMASREAREGRATVLGTNLKLAASGAALANAAAAHALDYDNISLTVSGFIASPTLYPLLALAEEEGGVSGKRLIEAFVAGWEAEAGIARGLGVHHYSKGWHSTATLGHFGAAIGAGRLLGFDEQRMRRVIGVAASEASGVRTMIGNMVNPFHVGKAARNGVVAARLVQGGFTAHESVLETDWGFCRAFNGEGGFDLAAITSNLGQPYDLVDPGLVVKVYPCCGLIHSALDGVLDLVAEHRLRADDVREAVIAVHELVPPTMRFDRPKLGYEAKFSTPFCIATALREGSVKLSHFTDERAQDPDMAKLMARVKMVVHPDLHGHDTFLLREFSEVTLALADGRKLVRRVQRVNNRGSKGRPATMAELADKFRDCASGYADQKGAAAALEKLQNLENVSDMKEITACLRR